MPRTVNHCIRREQLAESAVEAIASGGLAAAGLRDVAGRSSVTTGALTHYFPAKAALLEAAYEAVMARLAVRQSTAPPDPADAAGMVVELASFLPTDADSIRDWRVWLAFSANALVDPRLSTRHRLHYARIIAQLCGDGLDPVAADLLVAVIDGLAIRILLEPGEWPAERVAATLDAVVQPLTRELPA